MTELDLDECPWKAVEPRLCAKTAEISENSMQVLAIKRDRTDNNWILVGFGGMSFTAAFQHDMEQSPFF
jgi:hypothetical protein